MSESSKNILFLSGTRADFGKLKSLIDAVNHEDGFVSHIFTTGMHLLSRYGSTYKEIEKSGFNNIHKYINQHVNEPMEMILANTIHGLSRYVHEMKPNMIVVHGDRVEALAGAIVGCMNNILVAHIEGGERSGTIDELIRHSVTKLSHFHLVSNEEAKKRVIQLGESISNIYIIGSADIDAMKNGNLPTLEEVKKHYEIPFYDYHIVMFHPVTTEVDFIEEYSRNLVDALIDSKKQYVVVYPNNDMGTDSILNQYVRLESNNNFRIFPSISFEYFLTLIKHASSVIGNSSAGIREAPIYGIPSINIGTRQKNRFKTQSIFDCGYKQDEIIHLINHVEKISTRFPNCDYFGTGQSSEAFKTFITDPEVWRTSPQKIFHDLDSDN